jgi:hypothetical protein
MPWKVGKPTAAETAPDWLRPYCKEFLQKLAEQGYAPAMMRVYDASARLLCQEVARRGLRKGELVGRTLSKAHAAARCTRRSTTRSDTASNGSSTLLLTLAWPSDRSRRKRRRRRSIAWQQSTRPYLHEQRGLTEATMMRATTVVASARHGARLRQLTQRIRRARRGAAAGAHPGQVAATLALHLLGGGGRNACLPAPACSDRACAAQLPLSRHLIRRARRLVLHARLQPPPPPRLGRRDSCPACRRHAPQAGLRSHRRPARRRDPTSPACRMKLDTFTSTLSIQAGLDQNPR